MTETAFKIGSVYRNKVGCFVRIEAMSAHNLSYCRRWVAAPDHPFGWAKEEGSNDPQGFVCLQSGLTISAIREGCADIDGYDLIPGELHQVNGEWIPLAGKPIEEAMQGVNAFFKAKALSDAPADRQEQPERLFAPLPKPEPKADRWAGFIVHKDNSPRLPEVEQHKLASLGSMSHQLGSAWKK